MYVKIFFISAGSAFKNYPFEVFAVFENIAAHSPDAFGNGYACEVTTAFKCTDTDNLDTFGNSYAFEIDTPFKSVIPNISNTVRYIYFCDVRGTVKCSIVNFYYTQSIYFIRNIYDCIVAFVSRNAAAVFSIVYSKSLIFYLLSILYNKTAVDT